MRFNETLEQSIVNLPLGEYYLGPLVYVVHFTQFVKARLTGSSEHHRLQCAVPHAPAGVSSQEQRVRVVEKIKIDFGKPFSLTCCASNENRKHKSVLRNAAARFISEQKSKIERGTVL